MVLVPSSSSSSSSSPSYFHVRDQLTTTTVFADPTALGSNVPAHTPVPIAAIAGGASAGVILAVLLVIGWKHWGRQIKKRERQELEKRKATQAAIAYRRSVLGGRKRDPQRSRAPSDRKVQFTGVTVTPAVMTSASASSAQVASHSDIISPPRPLRPRTNSNSSAGNAGEKDGLISVPGFTPRTTPLRRVRAGVHDGKLYKPLHPSPLALPPSPQLPEKYRREAANHQGTPADSTTSLGRGLMPSQVQMNEKPGISRPASPPPPATGRIPRIKASLSSLTGEARRQSKASQNSASEQSRHSSAGGSARRWSWWSLINGPGFSFRQIGVGTGKNRLSTDTSLYTDWREDDPSLPVGYAYSGVDDDDLLEASLDRDDLSDYTFVDSVRSKRDVERG